MRLQGGWSTNLGSCRTASGYGDDRIRIDPTVVRGLEYYTGPVFEAEITNRGEKRRRPDRALRLGRRRRALRWARRALHRAEGAGHRLLHRRLAAAGGACGAEQGQAGSRRRPGGRARHGEGPARRLPEDGAVPPPSRHPRRDVPGHRRHEGADEVCRQARRTLRRHPGRRRARQGRGADQGPDRGRQGRRHHQGLQGMARGPAGAGFGQEDELSRSARDPRHKE